MSTESNVATPNIPASGVFSDAAIARIEWLTLFLGALGIVYAAWHWGWRGALGMAIGVALSWINFRWLKGTIHSFGRNALSAQPVAVGDKITPPKVSFGALFKFFGRFIL